MSDRDDRDLNLREVARIVARRRVIVLVVCAVAVAGSLGLSASTDAVYEASAQVLVRGTGNDTIFTDVGTSGAAAASVVPTQIQVLESELVAARVRSDLGLDALPAAVNGTQVRNTDVVTAVVRHGDPATAQQLANAYVDAYIAVKREQAVAGLLSGGTELSKKLSEIQQQIDDIDAQVAAAPAAEQAVLEASLAQQRRVLVDQQAVFKQRLDQLQVDAQLATGGAQVLRTASLPTDPVEPTPLRSAVLALALGLLVGLGAAFVVDYVDDSVKSADDLVSAAGGLPVLGVVAVDPDTADGPVAASSPSSPPAESYRGLRTSLQFMALDAEFRTVQVTSPLPGDGKTTIASNLAVVFAQAGMRTLLVDADLRKPRLHEVFGVASGPGLVDVLLGTPYADLVQPVQEHLGLLRAGSVPPNPSEMLGSRQMRSLLQQLGADHDIVVIDSAPVLPVTDSVALGASMDVVVLVAQANRSSARQVADAVGQLQRVQAPLVGTVLNRLSAKGRGAYGYGYYGSTTKE